MDALVASLERKIDFLQQQHRETLRELHSEVERLTRQNKGPSYKEHKDGRESNTFQTQKQIYLEETLEDSHLPRDANFGSQTLQDEASETTAAGRTELVSRAKGGLITSLHPLRIHCNPSQPPRAPTLQECEVIIRQLYNANSLQSQEVSVINFYILPVFLFVSHILVVILSQSHLSTGGLCFSQVLRIKAVLRDIVLNKKITPENYILTKAYLADDKRVKEPEGFPKLPYRGLPQALPVHQANTAERMTLPALKQSLNTSFAERQRRSRAVQRNRLRRTVT
ncbi:coiled-coil domain-containing protein 74B isoform X2 [Salminus brasiliensis]|uniref:coiled-coil domain-containing protein 74B isoform X2 n=1 Tax=Salminus brasiliensis TaxID=930266 RepID=UPI003B82D29F